MIEIYTDGAYSPSRNQGGWAFVVLRDNVKVSSGYDSVKETTNNRMELIAAIEAIKHMNSQQILEFTIYSDSMYVIGTMTQNWRKKKNIDLWIEMEDVISSDAQITWKHTKGHDGNKWNEHCDMLAVHASQININD